MEHVKNNQTLDSVTRALFLIEGTDTATIPESILGLSNFNFSSELPKLRQHTKPIIIL